MNSYDLLIIGAGAAGLSAAKAAAEQGCARILLAERKAQAGGVLLQCAHRGFGDGLSGAEYVDKLLCNFPAQVQLQYGVTVLSITKDKTAMLSSAASGLQKVSFRELILATGCREIPVGALPIAGTRPTGVYTAGQLQALMNLQQYIPKSPAVIVGSGDLGLIMAEQLCAVGCTVAALVEQKSRCGGMRRNQCRLQNYKVPLVCNATVSRIYGEKQLTGVSLRDETNGTEQCIACKTLLFAVGYRPEQELIQGLGTPDWLQLCGNCKHVHSMIEGVIQEGKLAGEAACEKIRGGS